MFTLYTFGYQGATIADLAAYAAAGALILDTRLAPTSPNPTWRKAALEQALGSRYRWCQALGNVNFRTGGPIEIRDPETGLQVIAAELQRSPVILLCACRDYTTCHRLVVAELAQGALPELKLIHLATGDPLAELDPKGENTIRAISLWQPWATLMALDAKRIETRSWATPYRGLLAIAATAAWHPDALEIIQPDTPDNLLMRAALVRGGHKTLAELPLGAVLCVRRLVDCVRTERILAEPERYGLSLDEHAFGNYSTGRYGWITKPVHVFERPLPVKGRQGLWHWDVPEGVSL